MHVNVPAVSPVDLAHLPCGESSVAVAGRVSNARMRQEKRYQALGFHANKRTNARVDSAAL